MKTISVGGGGTVILPNVSFCEDTKDIHYNPFVDPYNGHEYVEIGGLKWATMNIGANSITDYGLYFQWGDTQGYTADQVGSGEGQKYFSWADYKYGNGTTSPSATGMTKYNSTDGKTILDLSDDAARANWGGAWRMPTTEEFQALGNAVNATWTTNYNDSGINGLLCTVTADTVGKGETLFFPAAGRCNNGKVNVVGSSGNYWSSSLNADNLERSFVLGFDNRYPLWNFSSPRYSGFSVRGVIG